MSLFDTGNMSDGNCLELKITSSLRGKHPSNISEMKREMPKDTSYPLSPKKSVENRSIYLQIERRLQFNSLLDIINHSHRRFQT